MDSKHLLTESEVCTFLRVSREAVLKFRRCTVDPIPCLKAGRRYLYDALEVTKWARRQAERAHKKHHLRR